MGMRFGLIPRRGICVVAIIAAMMATAATGTRAAPARAAVPSSCALTAAVPNPTNPSPGHPCWTDYLQYPFGFDGNPVDPTTGECGPVNPFGPMWNGDFTAGAGAVPACYLRVTSMAFRAWNRALAAVSPLPDDASSGAASNPFGVWLFNGTRWYPDPTFPGAGACPGRTVLWAGKLDYWLIGKAAYIPPGGSSPAVGQTLCRFDGVNLQWETLTLPQATLARLPVDANTGAPLGGISAGACYSWDNCWFFGSDGVMVHWDGQVLSDASDGPAASPWLDGDFAAAVGRTDSAGNSFGFAVTDTGSGNRGAAPMPLQPDGSPPPQLFGSVGGPFAPLAFSPPTTAFPGDPFTTDLVAVDFNSAGNGWVAGAPTVREFTAVAPAARPAPLVALTRDGEPAACPGYDAGTFGSNASNFDNWSSLSVMPDGSGLAGGLFGAPGGGQFNATLIQPVVVRAVCGQPPDVTQFRRPDPRVVANQAAAPPLVPDDAINNLSDEPTVVDANADNDAWAATGGGQYPRSGAPEAPHLYRWTDGQPPNAPAGDDTESHPSLFTLDAPIFVPPPPAPLTQPPAPTRPPRPPPGPKHIRLPPAVYGVRTKLGPKHRHNHDQYTLYVIFKVRRPVTIGVLALHRKRVVSTSGLRHFKRGTGRLALVIDRRHWPTGLRFVSTKTTG